jgi:hypothetical protein
VNSRLGKIQIQLLLNLLGQVPLIRKVSNSNFPLKFTSPKKETSKERRKILENDFQKKFEQKRDIECLAFLMGLFEKRKKGRLIPHFS